MLYFAVRRSVLCPLGEDTLSSSIAGNIRGYQDEVIRLGRGGEGEAYCVNITGRRGCIFRISFRIVIVNDLDDANNKMLIVAVPAAFSVRY